VSEDEKLDLSGTGENIKKGRLTVQITDRGEELRKEDKTRGIGVSILKKIVKAMKGKLEAKTLDFDDVTTFVIKVPCFYID
jgi:sensor histidine kinase regulating citrate/malate metabolism